MFINILKVMFSVVPNLPKFPSEVTDIFQTINQYIAFGIGFVNIFFPLKYAVILATLSLLVKNWKMVYKFVMYVVKKVPFVNIS